MLVFGILIFVTLLCFIIAIGKFFESAWVFYIIALLLIVFGLFISLVGIRPNNNPNLNNYNKIKISYDYLTKQDSVPFSLKNDLYEDCSRFNNQLSDNTKYHNDIWLGFYYPECDPTMTLFDLNKIK